MTKAEFIYNGDFIIGFQISGHSGGGVYGQDIVCAAISSAAIMTANTITDVIKAQADVTCDEQTGALGIMIHADVGKCQQVLEGFEQHMNELEKQYSKNLQVIRRCK